MISLLAGFVKFTATTPTFIIQSPLTKPDTPIEGLAFVMPPVLETYKTSLIENPVPELDSRPKEVTVPDAPFPIALSVKPIAPRDSVSSATFVVLIPPVAAMDTGLSFAIKDPESFKYSSPILKTGSPPDKPWDMFTGGLDVVGV